MTALYRQRHPESTVLYQVLPTYFVTFLAHYETRFQRRYGYLGPVVREAVESYLDSANPMCGFAGLRCLEFIACLTTHILDKGQIMIRCYTLYSNASPSADQRHRSVRR